MDSSLVKYPTVYGLSIFSLRLFKELVLRKTRKIPVYCLYACIFLCKQFYLVGIYFCAC